MYYRVYVVAAFLKHLLLIGGNSVTRGYMPLLWLWGLYCFCWFDWSRAVRKPGGHRDERAKTGTGKKAKKKIEQEKLRDELRRKKNSCGVRNRLTLTCRSETQSLLAVSVAGRRYWPLPV